MPPLPQRFIRRLLAPHLVAHAHSGTHSYVILSFEAKKATGSVQFPIHDLEHVLGIELAAGDDSLLVAVADRVRDLEDYAAKHFALRSEGGAWRIEYTGVRVLERQAGSYAILDYRVVDPPRAASLTIDYDGIMHERDHHEALVIVRTSAGVGRMRTQVEQEHTFSATRSSTHVMLPEARTADEAAGAARFLLAEGKEVARRVGKRLRR